MTCWPRIDYYEVSVNIALTHILKTGMTLFDVGANQGILSIVGGRQVGPSGQVVAFEGSPRIMRELYTNLSDNHASNVCVVPSYVGDQHNHMTPVYYRTNSAEADSMVDHDNKPASDWVKTIRLDQFIDESKLIPDIIKVDVEGAEPYVLRGLEQHFKNGHRPILILESWRDQESVDILKQYDYAAFDLHTMTKVAMDDVAQLSSNFLYYSSNQDCPMPDARDASLVATYKTSDFSKKLKTYSLTTDTFDAGLYVVELMSNTKSEKAFRYEIYGAGYLLLLHCTTWSHIQEQYQQQPLKLDVASPLIINLQNAPCKDFKLSIKKIS